MNFILEKILENFNINLMNSIGESKNKIIIKYIPKDTEFKQSINRTIDKLIINIFINIR